MMGFIGLRGPPMRRSSSAGMTCSLCFGAANVRAPTRLGGPQSSWPRLWGARHAAPHSLSAAIGSTDCSAWDPRQTLALATEPDDWVGDVGAPRRCQAGPRLWCSQGSAPRLGRRRFADCRWSQTGHETAWGTRSHQHQPGASFVKIRDLAAQYLLLFGCCSAPEAFRNQQVRDSLSGSPRSS